MVKGIDTFRRYFADYEEYFDNNSLKSYGLNNEDIIAVLHRVFG